MGRRMAALGCLLLTAGMLLLLPGVWKSAEKTDTGRVDERLKPPKTQLLTVWLVGDRTDSLEHLRREISAFEKNEPGVRVYLRTADAEECLRADALLPDVVLFAPFLFPAPEKLLLPLPEELTAREEAMMAGKYADVQYALPLWFSPNVLAVPHALLESPPPKSTPKPTPLLGLLSPTDVSIQPKATVTPPDIPWKALESGKVTSQSKPAGIALQQLQSMRGARHELLNSATVLSLSKLRALQQKGEEVVGFAMKPPVCDRYLLGGLTRDTAQGMKLLRFLLSEPSQRRLWQSALFPTAILGSGSDDSLSDELARMYAASFVLPNAFTHTRAEYEQLCQSAFLAGEDVTRMLLRLR